MSQEEEQDELAEGRVAAQGDPCPCLGRGEAQGGHSLFGVRSQPHLGPATLCRHRKGRGFPKSPSERAPLPIDFPRPAQEREAAGIVQVFPWNIPHLLFADP